MHIEEINYNKEQFLDELYSNYKKYKSEIQRTLLEFEKKQKKEYFYELCYCLLTPSTKAKDALQATSILKEFDFFKKGFDPTNILRGYSDGSQKRVSYYVRFHNVKANRLLKARSNWYKISKILSEEIDDLCKRILLVQTVDGFGYKEASHFLRNIGYKSFAIIDRHILKYLTLFGFSVNSSYLDTAKGYRLVEEKFFELAKITKIHHLELDLLLWAMQTGYVLK
ncbi:MAG: hypothetical protein N2517_05490 [Ignavibacteria bacterium]|nr:hypothetical protein [Ignavibacteria bacterium]